jgi:putative ABC transport system permease protein
MQSAVPPWLSTENRALFVQSARLAFWSVTRHRRRTAVALFSVAFGVLALILAGGFIEWIFWATREVTVQSGLGHVRVARQGFQDGGAADLDRYRMPADAAVPRELRDVPGVRAVAPRFLLSGLISHQDATLSFFGEGVDAASEATFSDASLITSGEALSPSDAKGILIGQGLAANLGVVVGDGIVLVTQARNGGINAVEGKVRGTFATVSKAYDDSALRMPLPLANQLARTSGVHQWVLVLDRTERTAEVVSVLEAKYKGSGLEFVPWYALADFYHKVVDLLSKQMGFIKLIIGLIIVLTITNSMMMGVMERTSEIGTAMALGTRERGILLQFIVEGVLLGVLGGLLGIALGVLLAPIISSIGIPMPPPPGQTRSYVGEIIVTPMGVLTAFSIAVGTALLAALYPARKASRTRIVDALRHNR